MFRFLVIFLISLGFLKASDLVQIYLNQGLEAVGETIEKELTQKDFWLKEIGDKNVSLGYYDQNVAIVVTNKSEKTFKVFFYDNGKVTQKFDQKGVLTGLMGDKEIEGDLKTPIGFYELGKKFYPGDPYYGPFAFATTYPNLLDKLQGKTGGGIWIHGYPLDGTRLDDLKTEGCIALYNNLLEDFSKIIQDQKVFALTEEKNKVTTNADEIASLLSSLFAWKKSWTQSDIKTYLEFYDEKDFRRFDKMKFEKFAEMKTTIFSRKEEKSIKFSNISISPYPNIKDEKIFRITFYEDYYTTNYQFKGDKLLYVKLNEKGQMKILAEQ
ncbi:murein L,D-transpeptidase family protein [Campylobacter sp. CCS1377]|uniref:Murein L,D-transpeptidase family protein n=1 Tax=Campylobacter sp. CCS1377 TaxID=3158229 RepID=A0AAU7E6U2_9BACT|nr:murein L,D-transpeptidase [Campylobacter jejuni]